VSAPYVDLTLAMMARFGAAARRDGGGIFAFEPTGYQAADLTIEPDASTASYFLAAAARPGSTVTIPGLGRRSARATWLRHADPARDGGAGAGHRRHDAVTGTGRRPAASSSCATSPTRCRRWPLSPRSRTAR
jgi:3-phosphoshikimate 1-carboxyvinyltransferase